MFGDPVIEEDLVPVSERTPVMLAGFCANGNHKDCFHTPVTCECECHHDLVVNAAKEISMTPPAEGAFDSHQWANWTRAVDTRRVQHGKQTTGELAARRAGIKDDDWRSRRDEDVRHGRAEVIRGQAPAKPHPAETVVAAATRRMDTTRFDAPDGGVGTSVPAASPAATTIPPRSDIRPQAPPARPPAGTPPNTIECPNRECLHRAFPDIHSLGSHLRMAHKVEKSFDVARVVFEGLDVNARPYLYCDECDFVTEWPTVLGRHKKDQHGVVSAKAKKKDRQTSEAAAQADQKIRDLENQEREALEDDAEEVALKQEFHDAVKSNPAPEVLPPPPAIEWNFHTTNPPDLLDVVFAAVKGIDDPTDADATNAAKLVMYAMKVKRRSKV